jgi:hypothetical protein
MRNNIFIAVLLATLPIMGDFSPFNHALILECVVVLSLWISSLVFIFFRPLFPKKLFSVAWLLFLLTLAQIQYYFFALNPLWTLSVLILKPLQDVQDFYTTKKTFDFLKDSFLRGSIFLFLYTTLAGICEIASATGLRLFNFPLPTLILMGLISIFFYRERQMRL